MKKNTTFFIVLFCAFNLNSQSSKNVLFIGNSYTGFYDLPHLVSLLSSSAGDTLLVDWNFPPSTTLQMHTGFESTQNKIKGGGWDYVVLQEQSQRPSFPLSQVEIDVFPYAKQLNDTIKKYNSCAETMFYRTWGRKKGDAQNCELNPLVCTYAGMDSLLALRYNMMAEQNDAVLSPVGAVWNYLIKNYPELELYQEDGSHPSHEGTYAAACCFYTSIFRKNPLLIKDNYTLAPYNASLIRNAVKKVVFDDLYEWNIGKYDPTADFEILNSFQQLGFRNSSQKSETYLWDFGDGNYSNEYEPIHYFKKEADYKIQLISSKCSRSDTMIQYVKVVANDSYKEKSEVMYYPNPVLDVLVINAEFQSVEIYNLSGLMMSAKIELGFEETKIDFSFLSKGVYVVKGLTDNVEHSFKVVKK